LLMLAGYQGHIDGVKVLLAYKADPELRNNNGQTPIAGAAFKGDLPMIQILIEQGADVEGASSDGKSALMMATMFNNRTEIVNFLLGHGAKSDAKDMNGVTPLTAAKMMGATNTTAELTHITAS
ncbi:MAG: ankyrin repeat domain-containing protein, partial [Glaciimonas sp.]|nr:ankyrin repeat domain-containing protein [Glaciimonas sp.]